MKLVVGLGNRGRRYANTRHNVGWRILDNLAKSFGRKAREFRENKRFHAAILSLGSLLLAKPLTYMNESGRSLKALASFHKIKPGDILVISDDLDMEFGRIRLRQNGSSGGHQGLQSIIDHLESQDFARLKVGIGRGRGIPAELYVLQDFSPEQKQNLPQVAWEAVKKIENWIKR